jgi:hypothetical protein
MRGPVAKPGHKGDGISHQVWHMTARRSGKPRSAGAPGHLGSAPEGSARMGSLGDPYGLFGYLRRFPSE